MPKFGATWPDEAHRDLRCSPGFASRSISSRHFTAICRVSSKFEPGGGRNRSTNCPESICGNSSVPTCIPSSQRTRPHAAEIDRDHDPPESDEPGHDLAINREDPVEQPAVLVVVPHVLEQPHAHDRHERAGEQVRRDHGEADPQGQRHEQRPERVAHDERRDEHRQDAEHGQQPRHGRDEAAVEHRRGDVVACAASARGCSRRSPSTRRRGCRSPAPCRPAT